MIIGEVEQGIKCPLWKHDDRRSKYPWGELKVGDSILFIPEKDENPYRLFRNLSNSSRYWGEGQYPVWKFVARRMKDDSVRVWRIE